MSALTANLDPSLELMADMVRNPAFAASEVARVKDQRLADIAQEQASPGGLAQRALGPLIYGPDHPYGSVGASGTAEVVEALTPGTLATAHDTWLRPDLARITVVGDMTMVQLIPALERAFGDWRAPATAKPVKELDVPTPPAARKLVVIDRPNSPQSVVLLARVLPVKGTQQGMEALTLANEVIGNGFLSRLNQDIREDKGWSYGVRSAIGGVTGKEPFTVSAPVQSDRTADAIRLMLEDMQAFASGAKGVDQTELQRVTDGNIRGLPNSYQTNSQVLGALLNNQQFGRPDDYQRQLPDILRAIDATEIDAAARQYLSPENLAIIVVGDRAAIDDQLKTLNMPIEYLSADAL
jgi:predicted Zn-dependent peptidase